MKTRARRAKGSGRRGFLRRLGASVAATLAAPGTLAAQAKKPTGRKRPGAAKPGQPSAPAKAAAPVVPPPAPREAQPLAVARDAWPQPEPGARVDMAPARWIWLPAERTLANSFVLFRRELELQAAPASARGWISADSRYRLFVNGRRVQRGPAPCDPRSYEADPLDLTRWLVAGRNVIGVEVLFYGHGEDAWPFGRPGLLFALRVELPGVAPVEVRSDESWRCAVDRAHRPGQFRRSRSRSLQEELDARLRPAGWSTPAYEPDAAWAAPQLLEAKADAPAAAGRGASELAALDLDPAATALRARELPLVRETPRPIDRLVRSGLVRWRRDPRDWFDFRVAGAFEIQDEPVAAPTGEGAWRIEAPPDAGAFATFELPEQMVGFPFLTVDAPAGAVIELVAQEAHAASGPRWLDTHEFSWTRFVCRAGENAFECFEPESLRFLQVHVHAAAGPVELRDIGVRRRSYPWPKPPSFRCSEPAVQRLLEAAFNTLTNAAQETVVEDAAAMRQSSGAVSQLLHAARLVGGDRQLSRRFLRSYALGQTGDGWFLEAWPAAEPLCRVALSAVGAARGGPTLAPGVALADEAWWHYLETGDSELPLTLYPRFVRFAAWLLERRGRDGLLPAPGWAEREEQCGFNLLAAAVLERALAPLAALAGDSAGEKRFAGAADAILKATVAGFWSRERALFVSSLPWQDASGQERLDDRALAVSLLFDQCPGGRVAESLAALETPADSLVLQPPAASQWRLQALARHGRIAAVLRELRERWARMRAVLENNTISERWEARPDSTDCWSHCGIAPLVTLYRDVAGIRPAAPGFARAEVRPQLGDLEELELVCHTPRGPISFRAKAQEEGHRAWVTLPADCPGELVLPLTEGRGVALTPADRALDLERFALPAGETTEFDVPPARTA